MTSINPTELLQLLKSRDFDAEVRGRQGQVISDQELENLLDRSDLQAAYEQRKGKSNSLQNRSISIANALEILQSCTKPSLWGKVDIEGA